MPNELPPAVGSLLDAREPARQDECWAAFVATYSRLILHVTRAAGTEHDAAMDRYAFVLEQLRGDDFRRLRTFVADGRSEFSTWLVVVVQRLCHDHERHRYGRMRSQDPSSATLDEGRDARRRLVDLLGAEVDPASLIDKRGTDAESALVGAEIDQALNQALARLDRRDRLLIKLRFEDDLPMPEVASTLRFPTRFHAYRRLKQVLSDLRRALEQQGIGDSNR